MGKIAVEEKTTTTQKEKNKQAIQNINKSGTVSGKSSGVSNVSKVVNTNINTSNLSGTNQKQNGSPKVSNTGSNPAGVNTKSYNLAGSNNIKASTGTSNTGAKTYNNAYTTNSTGSKVSVTTVADNQKKYQSDLNKMADSSVKKAQSILQRAGDFYNDVKKDVDAKLAEDRKTPQKYTVSRMIEDKINETNQKNMAFDEDQRNQYVNSIREEDVAKMMDENGNLIDFQPVVKQLETQLAGYDQLLASEDLDEKQRLTVENERRKTAAELEEKRDLFNKTRAWTEKYQLDYYEGHGDLDTANSLREQFSHKDDNMLQRFGNAAAHLITETANEIPTAIDQIKLSGQTNVANDYITELEALHDSGEISDDQYAEGLKYWGQALQDYKDDYFSSFSQQFRSEINQLSANTHYGASEIEDFMLQAGESTAQFVLHYAIGKATSSFVFGENAVMQAGTDLAIEQYGAEAIKSMGKEQLMNLGSRVLGGEIATTTMSLASSTSKFNQLLQEGYDVETAMQNAIFTGLVSYAVEKVGMDRFIDMLGTDISVSILGEVLKKNVSSALSEGAEELVEGLIDPVVDFYTLGKDVEVNGSELWMAFLLGGTSGLAMSMAADVGSVYNSYKLNQALMNNQGVRQALVANTGKLLVGTRAQYNMLKNEVNKLDEYKASMTPDQLSVAEELSNLGKQALSEYEAKSTTLGVEFPEDTVTTTTQQENDQTLVQTLESDFNQDVKMNEDVNQLLEKINNDIADLAAADVAAIESIQQSLYEHGYDIDANLFSQLSEAERNNALVAADFSKITGINAKVTDYNGIRDALINNGFNGTQAELNDLVNGSSGFVNKNGEIFINALKRPVLYTLTHELTHGTESSKYYEPLKKIVQESTDWETNYKDRAKAYKWAKKTMSEEEFKDYVEKETVARSVEKLLGDEKFINDLVKYNYSLASRIWQDLNAMGSNNETDKIRNAFEKAFADNYQQNMEKLSSDIAQMDADYMKAIENGDVEGVKKIIDKAAKESDYPIKVFHGTINDGFSVFDPYDKGFSWFTKNSGYAYEYTHPYDTDIIGNEGRAIYEGYLKDGNYLNIGNINEDIKDRNGNFSKEMQNVSSLVGMTPQELLDTIEKNRDYLDDDLVYDVTKTKTYADLVRNLGYDGVEAKEHGGVTTYGVLDSSAFKRAGWYRGEGLEDETLAMDDIVERDDNGNVIPLSERFNQENDDIRYSYDSEDQYGYHYGASELDYGKKSETLWQRSGRGTGAFGTGTYVFGEEGKNDATYFTKDRTEHKIDMSDYNLFKVKDTDQGYRLHQLFKELDDNYYYTGPKTVQELQSQISSIIDGLNEIEYDEEGEAKLTEEQEETLREQLLELGDTERQIDKLFDENRNTKGGPVLADYLADSLNERYIEEYYWRERPHSLEMAERQEELMSHIPELASILGEDEDYMYDVVNEAIRSAEIDSNKRDFMGGKYDSVGTRVMKKLGYEGIDVRGIKGLDNSTYGSVIYDLNPDTVRYSYDQESDIIDEETNDELKRIQDPNSTLSKEQLALLKSRDPAFIKEIRGRITTLFRDGAITDSSSYNDTKRVVKVNGDDFYEFFKANKNYLRDPETVDLLDKKDYQDGTAYMSDDGLSGFYITKDGDLKSVFNNSGKPYFLADIKDVVTKNAKTLDCFQSDVNRLATMYSETFGFKVASILDYNKEVMEGDHGKKFTRDFIKKYGKAPVYFMVNTNQDVKTEHFNKDQWKEAYDYRNSFVNKVTDDLNVTEAEMKKYKMIKPVTERTKSIDKNIDKNTGVYQAKGIIELESTIGKTTHEEEIKDGEEYAGKVAQQLDNGADPEDILKQLKANPLNNGLIRAYYTSQVLADRGLKSEYMELVQWARDIDNLGGKLVESTKILYDLSDTFSRAVYLTTVQDNLVDEYKLKYGNKDVDVDKIINEIFQKSFDAITHSETIREFRKAVGNLAREVNRAMPKTIWDRITQYRMIAMLSGTKTAVSNLISNVFTTGLYRMKDFNQAAIEAAVQQITVKEIDDVKQYGIKQGDRQTTFKLDKEATKRNKAAAKEIFDQLEEASKTKYGEDVEKIPDIIKKRLKEAHSTTKKPIAKALDNLTELVQSVQQTMLDDTMFTKGAFVYKFNQLAQARGIDVRTVDRLSKEFNKLVDDAYDYAEEVVSHDATDISNTLSNLQKRSAKNVRVNQDSTLVGLDTQIKRFKEKANEGQPIFKAIDAVVRRTEPLWMPFYKTNASVMKKALQYSPLEIVQVINDYSRVKANKMDLVDMVEHVAKFATGTELYILGAIFSRLGWLKWDKDDEDYTGRLIVKIPGTDKGITADFIDPVSTIFTKGVVFNQELMEEGVSFKFLADLVNDYEDIFLADELDMFSTLKDFFDTVGKIKKGKDDYGDYTLADGAADVSFTILNSYIPAIVRDISRIVDPAKKVTYTSDQKKYLLNRLLNSTPFRTKLVDKKDATGNTLTYTQPYTKNDLANRIITQMVSRGKLVDMEGKAITTTQQNPENKLGENASEFTQMAQDFQFKDDNGDGYSDQHWIRDTVPTNIYPGNEQVELTPEEKDTYGKTWTETWTTGANSLLNNSTYKNLSYENQADVVYELQSFSRRVIEAEYCQNNKMDMTDSQKTALKLKEFCTKNGKLNGDLLSLIALGTAKENKLSNGGQQYVLGKKGEDGKTIRNSRQLYMRQLYEEAGVYDDILKAVESGEFEYADFGLSKTVVKQSEDKSKANYQDIYNKTMSKSNGSKTSGRKAKNSSSKKASSKKISGGSLKGGGSVSKLTQAKLSPAKNTNLNFFKAYQSTFNQKRGSSKVSESGSSSQVCPNCGARVSANASRCPNCGAKL